MDKTYNHKNTEEKIYSMWESAKAFLPKNDSKAKSFTIIMPPPNANNPLHIGHAMFVTIEDILVRFHRMKGDATLWLPGTDHAGIETQYIFEKNLKKQGKSRFDFDRDTLYKMIWDYVQENSDIALIQLKRIGASADWSRYKFTLDKDILEIVLQTFKKLHEEGLIYKDLRLINYCTRCGTGYSDLEAKHEVRKDPMLYMKYDEFTIATVRPETKFRDTALAVNPNDKRYKDKIGKSYEIMGLLGPITMKIISDPEVDPEFGTGIMKVTPAHDFHDFELSKKHGLAVTPIIDLKGKMDFSWFINDEKFSSLPKKYQERAQIYHRLHVTKMRPLMIEHLKEDGLLEKADENYEHTVSVCYRCGSLLEPLPLPQFFLRVKPLTEKALIELEKGKIKIHGAGHHKILKHWLENLKDWNISRQIVWGIRLPIWYPTKNNPEISVTFLDKKNQLQSGMLTELLQNYSLSEIKAGLQNLSASINAQFVVSNDSPGDEYIQETDTFDTWFSSGQWPFATLKTTQSGDFERFYPTQVMETAYDILPFWVMRMLMLGIHMTGKVPFEHVYFHGLVRDEKGQKMSKSKGNVINPLDIIEKYGADALRMALVMSTTAGLDSATGEGKIRGMRNFTNKIWNAARFIQISAENKLTQQTNVQTNTDSNLVGNNNLGDEAFHKKLSEVTQTITQQLEDLKVGLAAETVYNEFWHWFCDIAIEEAKQGKISQQALNEGLVVFLKLLHPFVPFVTEEIWQTLNPEETQLVTALWPNN